jgi:ParB family chromosome partitioning protein
MRTGLGRGLDVLLGQSPAGVARGGVVDVPLEHVVANPDQPRQHFDEAELQTLAASIRRHGVLQPIVVARRAEKYELVAGHRRVLASRLAGRTSIPAVVRDDVGDRLELALVENIERSDLNALEEARAYRLLMDAYDLTQEQLAARIGRSQSAIANTLRVLSAPQILQDALIDRKITEGHVRALLQARASALPAALAEVISKDLSVREAEALARKSATQSAKRDGRAARSVDPDLKARTADLRAALGTKVEIQRGRKGGRITIDFYSNDDFERLYELLMNATK